MPYELTGILYDDGEPPAGFCVYCPQLDVLTQGDSVEHAREMILDAVQGLLDVLSVEDIDRRLQLGLSHLDVSDWDEDDLTLEEVGRFTFSVEVPVLGSPVG